MPQGRKGVWTLEIRHVDGAFETYLSRIRWFNFGSSLAVLVLLAAGTFFLYILYQRSQRMVRLQGDFVATVSHELRSPLSVLRSAAENMAEGLVRDPDQAVRYGQRMLSEADRLLDMTRNVLSYAGIERNNFDADRPSTLINVAQLVENRFEAWQEAFENAQSRLVLIDETKLLELPHSVRGDRTALAAAIDNLLSNALRHGHPAKGPVELHVAYGEAGLSGFEPRRGKPYITIEIRDHGPGINRKDRKHLFEPFYRPADSAPGGIGLGLSLVRRIAEAHGGSVSIREKNDYGACFSMVIPAALGENGKVLP